MTATMTAGGGTATATMVRPDDGSPTPVDTPPWLIARQFRDGSDTKPILVGQFGLQVLGPPMGRVYRVKPEDMWSWEEQPSPSDNSKMHYLKEGGVIRLVQFSSATEMYAVIR